MDFVAFASRMRRRSAGGGVDPSLPDQVATGFTILDVGQWPIASQAVDPSAFYDAARNVTVMTYVAGTENDLIRLAEMDHATGVISFPSTLAVSPLPDDDHIHCAPLKISNGYYVAFYGSHETAQSWAISDAPGDASAWTVQTPLMAATYPRPVDMPSGGGNGTVFLFFRSEDGGGDDYGVIPIDYTSDGTMTPGSAIQLLTTSGRVYNGGVKARGNGTFELIWTYSNSGDSYRRHVYYALYDEAAGELTNFDGSFTQSIPMSEAEADSNFKILDVGTDHNSIPKFTRGSSDSAHVVYARGSATGSWNIYHMLNDGSGWSTPEAIGTTWEYDYTTGFVDGPDMLYSEGRVLAGWPSGNVATFNRGGESLVVGEYIGGVWTTATVATPPAIGSYTAIAAVRDGRLGFCFFACERYAAAAEGELRLYTVGTIATSWVYRKGGVSGLWNIQNLDTLWSDDGVTPATVNGTVYRIDDLSGWGNHLRQATGVSQAILRQDGSSYYLEFDGTNDFYETGDNYWQTAEGSSLLAAVRFANLASGPAIIDSTFGTSSTRLNLLRAQSTGSAAMSGYRSTTVTADETATGIITNGVDHVMAGVVGAGTSTVEAFIDGVSNGSTAMGGAPNTGQNRMSVGFNRFGSNLYLQGRIYGLEAYASALTTDEREAREAVLAAMFP